MITVQLRSGSISGNTIADLTAFATSCRWSRNLHGAKDLSITAPRSLVESVMIYSAIGLVFVLVFDGVRLVWSGRLAAPELWSDDDGSGVVVRAYGLWEALDDVPYTALLSSTSVADWRTLTNNDRANRLAQQFVTDNTNRLFMGLKQGQTYSTTVVCGFGFQAPHNGVRPILGISADVEHNLPSATWKLRAQRLSGGFGGTLTTVQEISGAGSLTTTTINQTWVDSCDTVVFDLIFSSGTTTYSGEDGASYVELTNVRVYTTTTGAMYADTVAVSVALHVNGVNSFINAAPIAASPGYDLTDLAFEDAKPTAVLNQVAAYGDGAGTIYTAGVTNAGQLYLWPIGTNGRTWYVDVTDMRVSSDRTKIANSVYAIYKEASERKLRTSAATDSASILRYGYTRRAAVDVDTTSSTRATEWRDTYLADRSTALGQAGIAFDRVYTAGGGLAQLTDVAPGDTIIIRNLPLIYGIGSEIDRIRSFRITETEYDAIENRLTVTPETPLPRLDVLIAQGAI